MPVPSHHPAGPPLPVNATHRAVRLVGADAAFLPIASPVLTLRQRITGEETARTSAGDEDDARWPRLVRVALPIILSTMLWGVILALILRR